MNEEDLAQERSRSLESQRHQRLMALLNDLMYDQGRVKAAELLGVSYRILVRAVESGRLTRRLSDALERLLLAQEVEGSVALRERVRTLEGRMEAVEKALRDCAKSSWPLSKPGTSASGGKPRRGRGRSRAGWRRWSRTGPGWKRHRPQA